MVDSRGLVPKRIAEHEREFHGTANDPAAAIVDLAAITGGEAPTEVEHNVVRTRVNLLTQIMRDRGLITP